MTFSQKKKGYQKKTEEKEKVDSSAVFYNWK